MVLGLFLFGGDVPGVYSFEAGVEVAVVLEGEFGEEGVDELVFM